MCWRVTAYFTARPGTTWAASAASIMSAWGRPLDPKPPPTWGLMIRSRSGSMPRIGEGLLRRVRSLGGGPQGERVTVPAGTGGVGLHRVVVLDRRGGALVEDDLGGGRGGAELPRPHVVGAAVGGGRPGVVGAERVSVVP